MTRNSDDNAAPITQAATEENHQLLTMFKIARTIATERDLMSMLPQLLAGLVETIPAADAGVLMLFDADDERLKPGAIQGFDEDVAKRLHLAVGEAVSGKVFESGQARIFATLEETAKAMADMSPANRQLFQSATVGLSQPLCAIGVPLMTNGDKVGTLVLENLRQPGRFSPSDLTFLEAVAELITLAIENLQLSKELQVTEALREANRLKDELISTLAHEMRTPLTSIKGYSSALLMEDTSFSPQAQREFLQIIGEECDVLEDLIHDLLESSIIDAGLLRLEPQPVLLPRLAHNVIEGLVQRTDKYQFMVDFPDDFPIIDADPQRIVQVLRNLVDNAIKYSPNGGLVVIQGMVYPEEVVVSVADQGVGIAPEHLNRLFEKYFRIESGLVRHVVGSGLGLPISHTIIQSHGGRIWAESRVGEGTTFYFALPRENDQVQDAQGDLR